jgi:hypothetical protein
MNMGVDNRNRRLHLRRDCQRQKRSAIHPHFAPVYAKVRIMCRSIKVLRSADPPTTSADISAAALQFVRKVSGYRKPSRANEQVFNRAILEIAGSVERLLLELDPLTAPGGRGSKTRLNSAVRVKEPRPSGAVKPGASPTN